MKVVSLNLRAYPNPEQGQIARLAELIADQQPDLVLLQECKKGWLEVVCQAAGFDGVRSQDVKPTLEHGVQDSAAIAVRAPLEIKKAWRIDPEHFQPSFVGNKIRDEVPAGYEQLPSRLKCRYSARTLLAEIATNGRRFVAGSFHATPGTSKVWVEARDRAEQVHEWKPFFHGGVAIELAKLRQPFVCAIDANEPQSETADGVVFHWAEGRPGQREFAALLGFNGELRLHRADDLFRQQLSRTGGKPHSADCLDLTYTTRGGHERRFDSLWATREFDLVDLESHYKEICKAGGDHAMLVADLSL